MAEQLGDPVTVCGADETPSVVIHRINARSTRDPPPDEAE